MYLIRETSLRYKTNILCLAFNHAKESVSSKKCSYILTKPWAKLSETWNENLVQIKLVSKIKKTPQQMFLKSMKCKHEMKPLNI